MVIGTSFRPAPARRGQTSGGGQYRTGGRRPGLCGALLIAAVSETAEDRLYLTQLERHLRAIMQELPREQGDLLRRSFFQHQSQSTIARELDLPLGTVKSRQRLALSRLRGKLGQFARAT